MFALGLLLVLVGAALAAAEAHVPSHGVLGSGAVVALATGVALLVSRGRKCRVVAILCGPDRGRGRRRRAVLDRPQGAVGAPAAARPTRLIGRLGVAPAPTACSSTAPSGAPALGPRGRPDRTRAAGRGRERQRADAHRPPGRGMGGGTVIEGVLIVVIVVRWPSPSPLAASSVRVLREYERAVVFRLGRMIATKGPGLVILHPRDRPHGARLAAHRHPERPAAGRDHPRQRHRPRRRRRLLPRVDPN